MDSAEKVKVKLLPVRFICCPRDDLIVLIARMLNSLIDINDTYVDPSASPRTTGTIQSSSHVLSSHLTRFHSRTPPSISVYSYLARLARYSSLENAVLLSAVYYIDLLSTVYPSFSLNSLTVHRFLLTATTVGSKGLCDSFCTNEHYAKVGGIHANELDILEREFLTKVKYRILPRQCNIQKCIREDHCSAERKNSIDTLEDSKKLQQLQHNNSISGQDHDLTPQQQQQQLDFDSEHPERLPQAGYTILDLYYSRMISLIGTDTQHDDPQLQQTKIHYQLSPELIADEAQQQRMNSMIKTEPDTLSDSEYLLCIKELLVKLQNSHLDSTSSNEASSLLQDHSQSKDQNQTQRQSENQQTQQPLNRRLSVVKNTGSCTARCSVPLSPLKRPIDNDHQFSPGRAGKKRDMT